MNVPRIFNESLRTRRRDRAARNFAAHDFIYGEMADEMLDRLDDVALSFSNALVIGCPDRRIARALEARGCAVTCADPGAIWAERSGGDRVSEDALPYAPARFDLILCCGTLDAVNDLPAR